jgi:DNA polymerase family A
VTTLLAKGLLANYVISGSCADLLKVAMARIASVKPETMHMVATVHDELVLDVPLETSAFCRQMVEDQMRGGVRRDVRRRDRCGRRRGEGVLELGGEIRRMKTEPRNARQAWINHDEIAPRAGAYSKLRRRSGGSLQGLESDVSVSLRNGRAFVTNQGHHDSIGNSGVFKLIGAMLT